MLPLLSVYQGGSILLLFIILFYFSHKTVELLYSVSNPHRPSSIKFLLKFTLASEELCTKIARDAPVRGGVR